MSTPPRLNERALPTLVALSRFWQFKRKRLVAELQNHLVDAQHQFDALFGLNQQLSAQCAEQEGEIALLSAHNNALAGQLEVATTNLATIAADLQQERDKLRKAALALTQAKAHIRQLEVRQNQALTQIAELEAFLDEHKSQLLSREQSISLLESLTEQLKRSHRCLEENYADINSQHLSLTEKFSLVSNLLAQHPRANETLAAFERLVNQDYMEFAGRESSLADEAKAVLEMQEILADMQMLNNFPNIAGKTVLSIAGGFSSGKSEFVNSFIRNPSVQLATGINAVTVVPSYVICAEDVRIKGHSYSGGSIDLEPALYASMRHEYVQAFGFDLRRILPFISVEVPMDPELFGNLCIIDTPGYNPGASGGAVMADRCTAASLVSKASAMIWVIGLDPAGTISQSDIEFIESTQLCGESLYIVLSKADVKSNDDILQIMEQVADDLSFAGIECAGICAYSSTRKKNYEYRGLSLNQFLCSLNRKVDVVGKIVNRIDAVFDLYAQALKEDMKKLEAERRTLNAIKLFALEHGGTALFDKVQEKIEDEFPLSGQSDTPRLEALANECESLRYRLIVAAQKALAASWKVESHARLASDEFLEA